MCSNSNFLIFLKNYIDWKWGKWSHEVWLWHGNLLGILFYDINSDFLWLLWSVSKRVHLRENTFQRLKWCWNCAIQLVLETRRQQDSWVMCSVPVCSQVPLFVQIHHKWRRMYVGECQGPGVRTDFEMVHLRKVPGQYTHLAGLLDIFKTKIVSVNSCYVQFMFNPCSVWEDLLFTLDLFSGILKGCPLTPLPPVSMAIRLTFVLQDWQQYFWPQQPPGRRLVSSQ